MWVGIDSLEKSRFEQLQHSDKFLSSVFTRSELEYAGQTVNQTLRLAGIFCAKESFLKALGLGIGSEIKLLDIEVGHGERGEPVFNLAPSVWQVLKKMKISWAKVSITHTETVATAITLCG